MRGVGADESIADDSDVTQPDGLDAAIYARTSSGSQRFGYSIDEQISQCWEHCKTANWSVEYIFSDEAQSGRDTDRPQFQELLNCAESGALDVVVFWKLDRFCRSLADLVRIEDQLQTQDVGLQSVTEYIDTTTAVGRFNFRNLASAAELESDLTSQRVKMGMHGLAKDHKWPNEDPPLGYTKLESERLEVLDDEAELVRNIFKLYLRERSMPEVAFILNNEKRTTKQGEEWCRQSVNTVLSNKLYTGTYHVAGYEDQVEDYRIVSDRWFNTVEEVRYRFQQGRQEMTEGRKQSKAERVLEQYKSAKGVGE